jgi:glycosyltransferase involved in cell wall biosynthesis
LPSEPLRILQVIPSLAKGGAERLVLDLCNSLHRRDDTEVLLLSFHADNGYTFLTEHLPWVVCPSSVSLSLRSPARSNTAELNRIIREFRPRILHSHLFEAELVTRQQPQPGIAYVSHLHDNMEQFTDFSVSTLLSRRRFTQFYEKLHLIRLYRACSNHFIAISGDTEQYFRKVLPPDLHRITLLPNAINLERFRRPNPPQPRKGAAFRLVSTGSLVPKKNQAFLAGVLKILVSQGMNVHLDLLGEGPCRTPIEQEAVALGVQDRITLHGNVDAVEQYLHQADLYVHAATYEPFGLALLEAMAAGLPCIALDGKGNRDIVKDGYNGYLIGSASSEDFAAKVSLLAKDKTLYSRMSIQASKFSADYGIEAYTDRLVTFYRSLLGGEDISSAKRV